MSKVLLLGSTGFVGGMIANMLLDLGFDLRILVRKESFLKAQPFVALGAEVVFGDLTDTTSLVGVADGVDYVLATPADLGDSLNAGYEKLFKISAEAGVKQFVYLSNRSGDGDQSIPMLKAKTDIENALKASGLTYTIIKSDAFSMMMQFMVGGTLSQGKPFEICVSSPENIDKGRHYWIDEAEVAAHMVSVVGKPQAFNKVFRIGGDEALTMYQFVKNYAKSKDMEIEIVAKTEPSAWPMDQVFFPIMKNLSEYDSPTPDDMSVFEL